MHKIALLTFHDTTNFGALLQTFGLYKKLNDLGYDCSILNYQCRNIIKREVPSEFHFSINPKALALELMVKSKMRHRYRDMKQFSRVNMPKTSQPYFKENLTCIKENYDTYVVGSDMLWGLDITDHDYSYFLDFVPDDKRKFSYATSIGKDWQPDEILKVSSLLNQFCAISVREDVTAERLRLILNKHCSVVCDPTMLITPEEWRKYVGKRQIKDSYVLQYFTTDDGHCVEDAKQYAKQAGKKLVCINALPSLTTNIHNVFPTKVEDFISLFYYADTVFTASYHGMLFSLYFHKNLVYYERQPAYRMQTVAKRMDIENREGRKADLANLTPLDYSDIDKRMADYRESSIQFINSVLQ